MSALRSSFKVIFRLKWSVSTANKNKKKNKRSASRTCIQSVHKTDSRISQKNIFLDWDLFITIHEIQSAGRQTDERTDERTSEQYTPINFQKRLERKEVLNSTDFFVCLFSDVSTIKQAKRRDRFIRR